MTDTNNDDDDVDKLWFQTCSLLGLPSRSPSLKMPVVFLTRECAHAHERVIAIMVFSLGRLVGRLVGSVVNFRACAVNEF